MSLFGPDNPQYKYELEQFGIDIKCVSKWMDKQDIPRRQCGSRFGKHHNRFKGYTINSQGYKLIYSPSHPNKDFRNYVREHILIIEKYLGRYLLPNEIPHHINGNKLDNQLKNLYLFLSSAEHSRYHRTKNITPITQSNLSRFK